MLSLLFRFRSFLAFGLFAFLTLLFYVEYVLPLQELEKSKQTILELKAENAICEKRLAFVGFENKWEEIAQDVRDEKGERYEDNTTWFDVNGTVYF